MSTEQVFERDIFREAMASFPSGATIVTTSDATGTWWGFTASSFCSVSLEPPLVLICLANTAGCFPAFVEAQRWNIHVLSHRHADLAVRFATRGADKFQDAGFVADEHGLPLLENVSIALRCVAYSKVDGGDHLVLLGRVDEVTIGSETPFVYFRRRFHSLELDVEANVEGGRVLASAGRVAADGSTSLGPVFELDMGWV